MRFFLEVDDGGRVEVMKVLILVVDDIFLWCELCLRLIVVIVKVELCL